MPLSLLVQSNLTVASSCIRMTSESEADVGEDRETGVKARNPPLSIQEKEFLLELVKERVGIVECKKTDFGSKSRRKKAWSEICERFCSEDGMTSRTAEQLRKFWLNSKRTTKKAVSLYFIRT